MNIKSGSSTTNTDREKLMPIVPSNLSNIPRKIQNDFKDEDERELKPIRDSLDNLDMRSTPKEK